MEFGFVVLKKSGHPSLLALKDMGAPTHFDFWENCLYSFYTLRQGVY